MTEPLLLDVSRLVWRVWAGRAITGIDRTCLAYLEHYRACALAVVQWRGQTLVLSRQASERLFDVLINGRGPQAGKSLASAIVHGFFSRGKAREIAGRLYLNVGHTGLDMPGHAAWLSRSAVRPIYFVHDLIPLTHPEYCRPGEYDKHRRRIATLLRHGAGIVANSRDTLDVLGNFIEQHPDFRLPPQLVAPLGTAFEPLPQTAAASILPDAPYFVMLGTIEARKNHYLMLTLWADMVRQMRERTPRLIVIGQRGWEAEQVIDMLERSNTIRSHVIELSHCDDITLSRYLENARALLFPSFMEGYGLPLVEALARGTPVIASNLSVFRELAGEIPDYLSPIDGLGWRNLIEDYCLPNSARRRAQMRRMIGWTPPSWESHFARVDHWLVNLKVS